MAGPIAVGDAFARATAIQPVGELRWAATVDDGWDIGGIANGGYVQTFAVRAMLAAVDKPDPLTITSHFQRPVKAGPIDIAVEVGREGRTLSTASTVLRQDGKEVLRSIASFGDLDQLDGPELITAEAPALAAIEDCIRAGGSGEGAGYPPRFAEQIDIRHDPRYAGFAKGEPAGEAIMAGYLNLLDDEQVDEVALTLLSDAMPPAIFNTSIPVGWAPTIELTCHIRARPAPGPIATTYRGRVIMGGTMGGDLEMWDSAGRPVAQARQLALLPKAAIG